MIVAIVALLLAQTEEIKVGGLLVSAGLRYC